MGEIAEMMLDGTLCAGCGVFLNDEPQGYPCYCRDCGSPQRTLPKQPPAKKCKCPTCGKRVKEVGLNDHMRDAHPTQ